jgi:hypothetical protein
LAADRRVVADPNVWRPADSEFTRRLNDAFDGITTTPAPWRSSRMFFTRRRSRSQVPIERDVSAAIASVIASTNRESAMRT